MMKVDPEGGGHGWPPFFDRAMDGESENPSQLGDRCFALSGKVLSLVTFFAPAKKVTRLQAKASRSLQDIGSGFSERDQRQERFALTREFISFAGPKETNQRKGPSSTNRQREREVQPAFSDSPSLARSENGRHPWRPP